MTLSRLASLAPVVGNRYDAINYRKTGENTRIEEHRRVEVKKVTPIAGGWFVDLHTLSPITLGEDPIDLTVFVPYTSEQFGWFLTYIVD